MKTHRPSNDATRKVRRPLHRLTEANLPVFDPPGQRTLQSVIRFLRACKLEAEKPTGVVPALPKVLTSGHMVQVGDATRYVFEVVIVRDSDNRCFGLYMPPPPD
ncbi:MAG: hypothetical protein ACOC1F_06590, partial [Myxococcota bacterium]